MDARDVSVCCVEEMCARIFMEGFVFGVER